MAAVEDKLAVNVSQSVDRVKLQVPAEISYLSIVSACLRAVLERIGAPGAGAETRYGVELAVHEACTNIIEHAYQGTPGQIWITITFDRAAAQVVVDLRDTGLAFDLDGVKAPDLDEPQVSGYGLFLIHQMMDAVEYFPADGDNRWKLVKKLR